MEPLSLAKQTPKMTVVIPKGPIKSDPSFSRCWKQETKPKQLDNELVSWLTDLSTYSSLHGIGWSTRTQSHMIRGLVFLGAVFICVSLPIVLVYESIKFSQDDRVNTAVEWQKAKAITYPNITVCFAKYFDNRKMAKLNISNDMANYMTLALDLGVSEYFQFMRIRYDMGGGDLFESKMAHLELELDEILDSSKMSILDLYREVAISCDDFIAYCEVHREFYVTTTEELGIEAENLTARSCCQSFFTQPPFFNQGGTCFTTQRPIVETYPSMFSSIRIWLSASEIIAPEFDMLFKGSDAAERRGISWALSTMDHPSQVLSVAPQRASRGSLQMIGLEKIETDRSELNREPCLSYNQTFQDYFGHPITRLNCEAARLQYFFANCSFLPLLGYKEAPGFPPCLPKNLIKGAIAMDSTNAQTVCPSDCERTDFRLSISVGPLDTNAIKAFFEDQISSLMNMTTLTEGNFTAPPVIQELQNPDDTVVLLFYFKSFDYARNLLNQETFLEFLSKVGGWMSLAIGASIFSLFEIVYFLLSLLRISCRHGLRFGR